MGTLIDLAIYRKKQEDWKPLYCPVCGKKTVGDIGAWLLALSNEFVCSEECYQNVEKHL